VVTVSLGSLLRVVVRRGAGGSHKSSFTAPIVLPGSNAPTDARTGQVSVYKRLVAATCGGACWWCALVVRISWAAARRDAGNQAHSRCARSLRACVRHARCAHVLSAAAAATAGTNTRHLRIPAPDYSTPAHRGGNVRTFAPPSLPGLLLS